MSQRCRIALLSAVLVGLWAKTGCAGCVVPIPSAQIDLQLQEAEASFSALDVEAYTTALDALAAALPCASQELTRPLVARLHRAQGYRAWLVRDVARAQQAFAAARADAPDYDLPSTLVPENHPLRLDYVALPLDGRGSTLLPPPAEGTVLIDGAQTLDRPMGWPAVVQHLSAQGAVLDTWYLWPDDPSPVWPTRSAAGRPRVGLLVGAGGAAALSTGLYAAAWVAHTRYEDLSTPNAELDALRARVNGLQWASLGATGLAVGLGVGGLWPVVVR